MHAHLTDHVLAQLDVQFVSGHVKHGLELLCPLIVSRK
jgi:hypothetical protein